METIQSIETQTKATLSTALSAVEHEIPIIEKDTTNFITAVYQWSVKNPVKAAAIVSFIVGFILGTLV